ncbi:Uncharacterised protein [Vibrio cholerae]|uniref:Uncharacterized protein n=1 Tax=Vibrio cholerae TaxID=666 RepID=A0A656AV04_VIBCL|nr:Uncharacterised protein [Vibrio cholerae]CSD39911.1 Uncharacterised protein [Vibrio cholerae]
MAEIGAGLFKCTLAKFHKALDIPLFYQLTIGIDINRKIQEIRDKYAVWVMRVVHTTLQYI